MSKSPNLSATEPIVSTARLEAFSDGVFAIAITLLIFGIKVPVLSGPDVGIQLKRELAALWPGFLSFFVSFTNITVFWIGHHQMFRLINRTDRSLLWLNNAFLMCVSFIPFPAALIGLYGGELISLWVYSGTIILAGVALYVVWAYASSAERLLNPGVPARVIKIVGRRILGGASFYAVAILLALVNLTASRILLVLIPLFYFLPSSIDPHLQTSR